MLEINPIEMIKSAAFQLCVKPVKTIRAAMMAKRPVFLSVSFIPIAP